MAVQNLLPDGIELGGGHARCDVSAHGITRLSYGRASAFEPFNVALIIDRHGLLSRLRTVSSCTASPARPATGEGGSGPARAATQRAAGPSQRIVTLLKISLFVERPDFDLARPRHRIRAALHPGHRFV